MKMTFRPRHTSGRSFTDPSTERLSGPDRMAVGADGSVYVAVWGRGEVTALDSRGHVAKRSKTVGNLPSNIAFGPNDEKAIYVTERERGAVARFDLRRSRCPVFLGSRAGPESMCTLRLGL